MPFARPARSLSSDDATWRAPEAMVVLLNYLSGGPEGMSDANGGAIPGAAAVAAAVEAAAAARSTPWLTRLLRQMTVRAHEEHAVDVK